MPAGARRRWRTYRTAAHRSRSLSGQADLLRSCVSPLGANSACPQAIGRPAGNASWPGPSGQCGRKKPQNRPAGGRVRRRPPEVLTSGMPVEGEFEPSPQGWVREQVELYESSGGTQGTTLRETGLPVVIITNRGVRSGKLRKTPLMRVEHDGRYAAVASQGGAPAHPPSPRFRPMPGTSGRPSARSRSSSSSRPARADPGTLCGEASLADHRAEPAVDVLDLVRRRIRVDDGDDGI